MGDSNSLFQGKGGVWDRIDSDAVKLIHLLYVPTTFCNLGCRYCYLGKLTCDGKNFKQDCLNALPTLQYAVDRLLENSIVPFNISLHGGEVTTLPKEILEQLFQFIVEYYQAAGPVLEKNGFRKKHPHIKTNLYNFHKLYDLFDKYKVSISGSVDLPLSLHEKQRVTKAGKSSLERILKNIALLSKYPHDKKISATVFTENFEKRVELAENIRELHQAGFDMNRFNFMFGFESSRNSSRAESCGLEPVKALSDEKQLAFYNFFMDEFKGTDLEKGLTSSWFEEFTPAYCTNSVNCGEKFFLLQSDGNVYSCVRGQGSEAFHYGNVYKDDIRDIVSSGKRMISIAHKKSGIHDDCLKCDFLSICHTGCPFVKHQQKSAKSYTCLLQKELYRKSPDLYPRPETDRERKEKMVSYLSSMHPNLLYKEENRISDEAGVVLPNDLYDEKNSLRNIISEDGILNKLYSDDDFIITIDGRPQKLRSQILKPVREIYHLYPDQDIRIHVNRKIFDAYCDEPIRNTLHIQMLRDTKVTYGDEKRTKQEHLFSHEVFFQCLKTSDISRDRVMLPVNPLLSCHQDLFLKSIPNNMFVTTGYLRKYHYKKQKENAFYHIQAINLPFQNFEFYWN